MSFIWVKIIDQCDIFRRNAKGISVSSYLIQNRRKRVVIVDCNTLVDEIQIKYVNLNFKLCY